MNLQIEESMTPADSHTMTRPTRDEAVDFYFTYIRLVPPGNLIELASLQLDEIRNLFRDISEAQSMQLHAPYKWTLKQVVGHMIDAERVFADRLHRFACGDFQPIPGMEQEPYVANCDYISPSLQSLVDELCLCRQANVLMLRRLKPESWNNRGVASDNPVTVRALACILVGHVTYHLQIVRSRLQGAPM